MRRAGRPGASAGHAIALAALLAAGCGARVARVAAPVPAAPSAAADPCDSAATQLALSTCRAEAARRAEAIEAERYARALGALRQKGASSQASALEQAEQKWRDYRDATCRAAADLYAGGSMAGLILADCRARLAADRTAELRALYADAASR